MAISKKINLKVQGEQTIHCGGCENRIQRALGRLPGVQSVKANHLTQQIQLDLDTEQTRLEQIKATLDAMGYNALEE